MYNKRFRSLCTFRVNSVHERREANSFVERCTSTYIRLTDPGLIVQLTANTTPVYAVSIAVRTHESRLAPNTWCNFFYCK